MATANVKSREGCGKCGAQEEMDFSILCADCNIWIHYACSRLPTYQLLCLTKTNHRFTCEKCCLEKFCKAAHWIKEASQAMDRQRKLTKQSRDKSTKHDSVETNTTDGSISGGSSQGHTEHIAAVTGTTGVNTGTDVELGSSVEDTNFSQLLLSPMNPIQQGSSDTTTTQPASNMASIHSDIVAVIDIKKESEYLDEMELKVEVQDIYGGEASWLTRTTDKRFSSNSQFCEVVSNTNKLGPHTEKMHQPTPQQGHQWTCRTSQLPGVETVWPSSSMSGWEEQQQSASGVGSSRFDGQDHLEAGSSSQNEERKFKCQHCDKIFISKTQLMTHILTYSGVKDYECQQCGKRFTLKGNLTKHTLTHAGVKSFECLECGKRFTEKGGLTKHTLTHTGVKNYECQECGKRFSRKGNLTTHSLIHSGVKNYECQECGKRFTHKSTLTTHTLTHRDIKI